MGSWVSVSYMRMCTKLDANSKSNNSPPDYDAIMVAKKNRYSYLPSTVTQPGSDIPKKYTYTPSATTSAPSRKSRSSFTAPGSDLPRKQSYAPSGGRTSPYYSTRGSASMDTVAAEREFARFSYEAQPRGGSPAGSEREEERRNGR